MDAFYENFLNINGFEKFVSHTTREARIKDNEKKLKDEIKEYEQENYIKDFF